VFLSIVNYLSHNDKLFVYAYYNGVSHYTSERDSSIYRCFVISLFHD